MIYLMHYQMSDNVFAHFTNLNQGVYMKIPLDELNTGMLATLREEDPQLTVEVHITQVKENK